MTHLDDLYDAATEAEDEMLDILDAADDAQAASDEAWREYEKARDGEAELFET